MLGAASNRPKGRVKMTTALERFMSRKDEFDASLARLTELSESHFGVAPDRVTWADVGSLTRYVELLTRVTDAAFNEDYAGP
jgi:hypothetical protein